MIHESSSPMETIRFASYYIDKGLEVTVILWGPMGVLLGKKNKSGRMQYEEEVKKCLDKGVKFLCCELASRLIGMDEKELMEGIKMVSSFNVADLLLEFQEEGQLIISL
jgi:predicted peroxiredoxin